MKKVIDDNMNSGVAPFTGAWIEMMDDASIIFCVCLVAPFTGAWIEIRS